jgi:RNA-directed DNA polymerase
MDDITRIQRSFARKAQAQPDYRFRDLYSLVWKPSFLAYALERVLANQGSRSAGIDGVTANTLRDPEARANFLTMLSQELRLKTYTPSPGRRVFIPKANGQKRPLGILTLKDRVVQMTLKLLLEPIFEADFLDCSYGFRPGRRTMDCLVPIWRHANKQSKHYWVVEGDIRACFDTIQHRILYGLLHKRIADQDVLALIQAFLKAGVMEGRLFTHTNIGTQQGGILSPLLANLYLHQLDRWWWTHYGSLTRSQHRQRRRRGLGHPILIRYADDWLLLWNGDKAGAQRLKDEVRNFLEAELKLELSASKTLVTHIDDGFTFLGFAIRRFRKRHQQPIVLIQPSKKNIEKLKATIKTLTRRNTTHEPIWYKLIQVNQILQGWSAYYQHVNAKTTFSKLDWWVMTRMFRWAWKKHGKPAWRVINAKYRHRDHKGRINFITHLEDGSPIWLYRMSDRQIRRYWVNWQRPTYAETRMQTEIPTPEPIFVEPISYPARDEDQQRLLALRRDNYTCQRCQTIIAPFQVHHIIARHLGGSNTLDNYITLCRACHQELHRARAPAIAEG